MFSAEHKKGDSTYTWEANPQFATVLNGTKAADIAVKDSGALKSLAAALEAYATDSNNSVDKVTTITGTTKTELALGYYLVVDNGNAGLTKSQPILVAIPQVQNDDWVYDITVTPKSSSTDFTKKIAEGDKLVDTNTKNIGDYVDYRLWADVPKYSDAAYADTDSKLVFKITDRMSAQLTWTEDSRDSLKVYVIDTADEKTIAEITNNIAIEATNNYVLTEAAVVGKAGQTFTINFTRKFLEENKNRVVVVAFKAQLNEKAKISTETGEDLSGISSVGWKDQNYNEKGNPNAADLEYTNEFDANKDSTTNHIKDIVTTFTFKLDVKKVDKADNKADKTGLSGAKFTVYTDQDCKQVYTNSIYNSADGCVLETSDDGTITGIGFKEGTYYIKETKAPDGYKLYDGVITVNIMATKEDGHYTGAFTYDVTFGTDPEKQGLTLITVEDEKGLTLPGTGGMGTTLFTFGGIALILVAGIMFIVYTRKQKKQS